jgi:hypothetical protein
MRGDFLVRNCPETFTTLRRNDAYSKTNAAVVPVHVNDDNL